jgi:ABC-type transporter MlaC component
MKARDTVQVRQHDDSTHWIYAKVIDPATLQVQITHPGNREDGVIKLVDAEDIRTKEDVMNIASQMQSAVNGQLNIQKITVLAAADPWLLQFTKAEHQKFTPALHTVIVKHYQEQVKRLS